MKTIDCTPTWSGLLPMMIEIASDPTNPGHKTMMEEFKKMAQAADMAVQNQKALQSKPGLIQHLEGLTYDESDVSGGIVTQQEAEEYNNYIIAAAQCLKRCHESQKAKNP